MTKKTIILVDEHRNNPVEAEIDDRDFGAHIWIEGLRWDHVDTNADGVWIFAQTGR